jgi:probable rRNA maturation factor
MKKSTKKNLPVKLSDASCKVILRKERNLPRTPAAAALRRTILRVVRAESIPVACSVSLLFAGDETVGALNARFRGISRPTDVLSFAGGTLLPEDGSLHLGDVVLSIPRAEAQARRYRRTLNAEVLLLVVHGVLHLLGYDHDTPARKEKMWRAQRNAISAENAVGTVRRADKRPSSRRHPQDRGEK